MKRNIFMLTFLTVSVMSFFVNTQITFCDVKTPISVHLSISSLPILNQSIDVTCEVSSILDAPNTRAEIILPEGAQFC